MVIDEMCPATLQSSCFCPTFEFWNINNVFLILQLLNAIITEGERIYTAEYDVRGTLFRLAVVSADEHHIVAPGVDKSSRECLHVFHARTGARLHRLVYFNTICYFRGF